MIEDAYQIFDYLPSSFQSEKEEEYISFLWDTFESNYKNEKYQFAFLAYHMLYMSFIYFIIWQIKNNRPEDFGKAMIGFNKDLEHQLLNATSPFTFSEIPERSVFRFLKLVGCANLNIGNYTKLVDERNDIAHSNGNIFYADQKSVDEKIEEVLKIIGEIHFTSQCIASDCFKKFLTDSYDPDVREYAADLDQVREVLISKHFLSQKQIEICATFDIAALSSNPNYPQIKLLYEAFIKEYKSE